MVRVEKIHTMFAMMDYANDNHKKEERKKERKKDRQIDR